MLTAIVNNALATVDQSNISGAFDIAAALTAEAALPADDGLAAEVAQAVIGADAAVASGIERMYVAISLAAHAAQPALAQSYAARFEQALLDKGQAPQQAKVRRAELAAILRCAHADVGIDVVHVAQQDGGAGMQAMAKAARNILKGAGVLKGRQRKAKEADPVGDIIGHLNVALLTAEAVGFTAVAAAIREIVGLFNKPEA